MASLDRAVAAVKKDDGALRGFGAECNIGDAATRPEITFGDELSPSSAAEDDDAAATSGWLLMDGLELGTRCSVDALLVVSRLVLLSSMDMLRDVSSTGGVGAAAAPTSLLIGTPLGASGSEVADVGFSGGDGCPLGDDSVWTSASGGGCGLALVTKLEG